MKGEMDLARGGSRTFLGGRWSWLIISPIISMGLAILADCGGGNGSGAGSGRFSCDYISSPPHTCVDYMGFNDISTSAVKSTCKGFQGGEVGGGCSLKGAVAGCRITTMSSDGTTQTLTTWSYDETKASVAATCKDSASVVTPGG